MISNKSVFSYYVRWQRGTARIRSTPLLQQWITICCPPGSQQQTCSSGRTDTVRLHGPCCANNGRYSLMLRQRTETGRGWMQAWGVGSSLSVSADQYKQSDSSISNNALSLASHAMSTATSWCDSCLAIYLESWHRTNTPAAAVYSTTDRLWQYFWLWLAKWRLIFYRATLR